MCHAVYFNVFIIYLNSHFNILNSLIWYTYPVEILNDQILLIFSNNVVLFVVVCDVNVYLTAVREVVVIHFQLILWDELNFILSVGQSKQYYASAGAVCWWYETLSSYWSDTDKFVHSIQASRSPSFLRNL